MIGKAKAVARAEADPLMRALRLDKMTLAALEATLILARDADLAGARIPLWSMFAAPLDSLSARASKLAAMFRRELGLNTAVVKSEACLGGGSSPAQTLPSIAVAVSPPFPGSHDSEGSLARALDKGNPPVITRVQKGIVLFDLRTITEDRDPDLLDSIRKVCHDLRMQAESNGRALPE